jgi:hypothetical protein
MDTSLLDLTRRNQFSDDGRTLTQIVFNYVPNKTVSGIAGGIFYLITLLLFFRTVRTRSWWSLCLPIGAFFYATGFVLRIILANNQDSLGLFIIEQIFIICSPACFLAFNYIVYGRLITEWVNPQYSLLRPSIVAKVFITSDILTFLIQAGGSGFTDDDTIEIGMHIMLGGLVLQLISYVLFQIMFTVVHWRVHKAGALVHKQRWHKILWVLHFSSVFIVIRCVFRVAERADDAHAYLNTHEYIFYLLDVVPLFFATAIYFFYWPASYMVSDPHKTHNRVETGSQQELNTFQV